MSVKYPEFAQLNLPSIEQEILEKWYTEHTFEKSVEERDGAIPFVFYEGPPSANGMPGIHHVISRTLKDLVCRYKTMQGFRVERKGGWDTHGLPVELGVEKELGITKEDIGKKISIAEYNAKCREAVLRYKKEWDELTRKMGYWVDLEHPYITFDNKYIETLWWLLSQLYNKGLLYQSVSIQPYSPAAGTGLSSHELNQPGCYKEVKDTSCVAMFKALRNEKSKFLFDALDNQFSPEIFFLAWTTTPWTLPSNLGLAVGPNIDYVLVKLWNQYTDTWFYAILAKELLHKTLNDKYFNDLVIKGIFHGTINSMIGGGKGERAVNGRIKIDGKGYSIEVTSGIGSEENVVRLRNFVEHSSDTGGIYYSEQQVPQKWESRYPEIRFENFEKNILAFFKGKDLEGLQYEQLLPFEANSIEKIEEITLGAKPFHVLLGDFVTTEDGTGIVHIAPAFGADDFRVGKKYNIGILTLVDRQGKFVDGLGKFSNRYVKNYVDEKEYVDVNLDICIKLKKEGRAFKVEKYEHSYPHCWRTDKPVLYYPLDAWFIRTTACKDRMVELNKTINWKPKSTGEGRFGNWLENMVDWNLSRSRYWGTPLPIWKTEIEKDENGKDVWEEICIGSIAQLKEEAAKADEVLNTNNAQLTNENLDLHKPMVDEITLVSPSGKPMKRVPDLIDVWFDSGAMPYAQQHYPFENRDQIDERKAFPADFICEGVDQTRGWFYTLHAIAVMLFDSVAYKNVVSNGLVLDKNGNKMSKRLGNVINPFETIETFGADATRWYLITNASPWDNLKFDLQGIKEVQRKFFGTLYNTYQFFALYANVDGFDFSEPYIPLAERPEIDRWILSALNTLIKNVSAAMDDFEPTIAGRAIEQFVDEYLSNWYVRLCRRRFWKGEYEQDKISAYQTLYECLETVVKLIAPISPFFSDAIFRNLNNTSNKENVDSVHLARFPLANDNVIDTALEERMQLAQDVSSLVLSLRKKLSIKVRQPLQKVLIPVLNPSMPAQLQKVEDLIKAEVNVKEINYLTDTEGIINKKVKPNFKALGARLGANMKAVANLISKMNQHDIAALEQNGQFSFDINGETIAITLPEVEITAEDIPGWSVATKGNITVALDITITDDLRNEGDAREFINRIQNLRKDQDFELTDRLSVYIVENEKLKKSLNQFKNYICAEILADSIDWVPEIHGGINIDINDTPLKINVIKNT